MMRRIFKPFYISATLALLIPLVAFINVDDGFLQKAISRLDKWANEYPQEKVYLHLDKPYYAAGDNLWFKAYITIGPQHQLSALSNVLNVELIDEQDSVKKLLKVLVVNGTGSGDITLSDSLTAGTYRLRAYTNWMRNFSDKYFYTKTLVIGNVVNNTVQATATYNYAPQQTSAKIKYTDANQAPYAGKQVNYIVKLDNHQVTKGKGTTDTQGNLTLNFPANEVKNYAFGHIISQVKTGDDKPAESILTFQPVAGQTDVQFFPEGGNMVNGVRSLVAFKAVGQDGLGASVRGDVLDNNNQKVATIETQHSGMGSFALSPQSGKTYQAVLTFPDGSQRTAALPQAQSSGYVLSVSRGGDNISLKVSASPDLASKSGAEEINLVGQSGGKVYYAAKAVLRNTSYNATVASNRFPSGIVQFTLFSGNGQPVAERLAFVRNPADQLQVAISSDKQSYTPREQTHIKLHIQDAAGKPAVGSFSAAVIDETKVPADEAAEETILSNLLLTSDLQGYIEQPGYYFTDVTDKVDADLDRLLLTQGYRRFTWKALLSGQFPTLAYQPEKAFRISGMVKTSGGKPVPKGKVTLFSTSGGAFVLDTVTNEKGQFAFNNLLFKDSVRFIVQARTGKNSKNVQVVLDAPERQPVSANRYNPFITTWQDANYNIYLRNSKLEYQNDVRYGLNGHTILLKEVVVREQKQPAVKNSANLNGAGNADQIIKGDLFQQLSCTTIAQCLQGRLLGVIFRGDVPYSTRSLGLNRPMQIIVDGVYVSSDYLSALNPYDVGSIEILRSGMYTSIYGSQGGNGVMLINTKRGNDYSSINTLSASSGIALYMPKGFYVEREFYKPVYGGPKAGNPVSDLRTTIAWEKNLVPDDEGNISFDYYNADSKGTCRVVVEGISVDGYLGRKVYRYTVGK